MQSAEVAQSWVIEDLSCAYMQQLNMLLVRFLHDIIEFPKLLDNSLSL